MEGYKPSQADTQPLRRMDGEQKQFNPNPVAREVIGIGANVVKNTMKTAARVMTPPEIKPVVEPLMPKEKKKEQTLFRTMQLGTTGQCKQDPPAAKG